MTTEAITRSVVRFIAAGLCEIRGGYLVWRWWREGAAGWVGLVGAAILILYGIVPTFQSAPFGRVYAAYGGVFIILSLAWGMAVDGVSADRYDLLGALICLLGVAVIMYAPRR